MLRVRLRFVDSKVMDVGTVSGSMHVNAEEGIVELDDGRIFRSVLDVQVAPFPSRASLDAPPIGCFVCGMPCDKEPLCERCHTAQSTR